MHSYLKQSTASQSRAIGPFLDDTDFKTAETALTIANTDIKLIVNGGASADKNSGGGTHRANGVYGVTFDATDTATVGEMFVSVKVAGALPVFATFVVLEEAVYDQLFAASALGYIANAPVNVAQISGDTTAADNLETVLDDTAGPVPWVGIADQGTAQSATATTLVLRAATPFGANDVPIGMTLAVLGSDQGYWQTRAITDYVTATDTATVDTWTVTPSGTITYKVFGTAPGAAGSLTAADVWTYVTRELTALDEDNTTIDLNGTTIGTVTTAVNVTTVNGLAANVITAAATAADFGTEIGTAVWATADRQLTALDEDVTTIDLNASAVGSVTGAVGSVTGNVGGNVVGSVGSVTGLTASDVGAIKTKTDSLTFTTAGIVDANVQQINDVTITGNGQVGTEFGV